MIAMVFVGAAAIGLAALALGAIFEAGYLTGRHLVRTVADPTGEFFCGA